MSLANEVARAKAEGHVGVTHFEGANRNLDQTFLEKGDVFTIPSVLNSENSFMQKFGTNKTYYILCEGTHENGGNFVVRFYPSMLVKSVVVYEDTDPTEPLRPVQRNGVDYRVRAEGTAATAYAAIPVLNEAINSLAGKKIKVSDVKVYKTRRYGTEELRNTQVGKFDFVTD